MKLQIVKEMDIGYMDILTGEHLSSIYLANLDLINSSVRSYSRKEGEGVKGLKGSIAILASCEHHFIRVHENLKQTFKLYYIDCQR